MPRQNPKNSRPASDPAKNGFLSRFFRPLRDGGLFLLLLLRKTRRDNIVLIASALAFVTIFSLIPLLASFSFVGNRIFSQFEQQSLRVLGELLPYSDEMILERIQEFLVQTESLQGFALLVLFATAIFAFGTVEATLNRIWQVPRSRPLKVRLLSFTLLLFWTPILIGMSFSGMPFLEQLPALVRESLFVKALPHLASLVGLTMLYWLVPYATVNLGAAMAGGLLASGLLILLRRGFFLYTALFQNVNLVYGSFALTLFFLISIDLAWLIVLFGSEIAYVAQHFRALSRGFHRRLTLEGRWAGLAALAVLTDSLWRRQPLMTRDALAERLRVPPEELSDVLEPLQAQSWVSETSDPAAAFLLAADPHHLTLAEIFAVYDQRCSEVFEPLPEETAGHMKLLVAELAGSQRQHLEHLTLADLVPEEQGESRGEPAEGKDERQAGEETQDAAESVSLESGV